MFLTRFMGEKIAMISFKSYWRLMRFDRPIGIYLLLWPTLWGLWIAGFGRPNWAVVTVFVVGTVIMRAAGCVANDWCDRGFDGHVERTKNRPMPRKELTSAQALWCLFILICIAAALAVSFLNSGTIVLAIVGLLLALLYPFTKRFFAYPQIILSLAFAWGIPMAFWQLQQRLPLVAWVLFVITGLWIFMYDTQYALMDLKEDSQLGIHSSALSLGRHIQVVIRVLQLIVSLGFLVLGIGLHWSYFYFVACFFSACVFIYQDRCLLKKNRTASFAAFLSNHWVGFLIFIGIFISSSR